MWYHFYIKRGLYCESTETCVSSVEHLLPWLGNEKEHLIGFILNPLSGILGVVSVHMQVTIGVSPLLMVHLYGQIRFVCQVGYIRGRGQLAYM